MSKHAEPEFTVTGPRQTQRLTAPWYNLSYYLLERGSIVKIHGRYCGPDWTAGRSIAAADYLKENPDFSKWPAGIDGLDRACRRHDYNCAIHNGCTKADDTLLIKAANRRRLSQADIARKQLSLLNPFMSSLRRQQTKDRLEESNKARQVEAGITAARLTRKR